MSFSVHTLHRGDDNDELVIPLQIHNAFMGMPTAGPTGSAVALTRSVPAPGRLA
jgi:hypothetical protein